MTARESLRRADVSYHFASAVPQPTALTDALTRECPGCHRRLAPAKGRTNAGHRRRRPLCSNCGQHALRFVKSKPSPGPYLINRRMYLCEGCGKRFVTQEVFSHETQKGYIA